MKNERRSVLFYLSDVNLSIRIDPSDISIQSRSVREGNVVFNCPFSSTTFVCCNVKICRIFESFAFFPNCILIICRRNESITRRQISIECPEVISIKIDSLVGLNLLRSAFVNGGRDIT